MVLQKSKINPNLVSFKWKKATGFNLVAFKNNIILRQILNFRLLFILLLVTSVIVYACSKGGGGETTPTNPCAGVTVTVSGTIINPSSAGASDGSISATAAGSNGLTFNLNGGAFQASGNFTNLAAGSYTINAKNGSGCTGSVSFTLTASNPCTGVTITVSATTINNTPCQATNNGSITITTNGGSGAFTYSLNGGPFQSSNIFSALNGAVYTVTAKDANGCTGTANITVSNNTAGPLFTAVQALIQGNCAITGCHGDVQSPLFTNQCNIVSNNLLIKARAVDGSPSFMPPTGQLPASEKLKITNWINAGGQFNN